MKNQLKKARNIARNITDLAKNPANMTCDNSLYEFIESDPENAEKLLRRFESEELTERKKEDMMRVDANKERDVLKLVTGLQKLSENKMQRIKRRINRSIISAASAAIVLLSLIILWEKDEKPTSHTGKQTIKVPTLITDNGEKIDLNNVDNKADNYSVKIVNKNSLLCKETQEEITYNKITIPAGYTYNITLIDGTEILLNAGSSIKYPTRFENERVVEMTGEVYFKVAKSETRFIVKVGDIDVKVYGTEFNINEIGLGGVEMVLVNGEIGVAIPNEDEIIMAPHQMLSYDGENHKPTLTDVNAEDYIKWKENEFSYVRRSLLAVLSDIERWYNVDFDIRCDISTENVTLLMNRELSINDALELIELIVDVKFIKEGGNHYSIVK